MQANTFNVTGSWQQTREGHVFEAEAKTVKAARVIAVARGQMSLGVAHPIEHYVSAANRTAIEQSVRDLCHQMALAFPD